MVDSKLLKKKMLSLVDKEDKMIKEDLKIMLKMLRKKKKTTTDKFLKTLYNCM